MSSSRTMMLLAVGAAFLAAIHSAEAIKCYQCHSLYDKNCADLNVNDTTSQSYLKECDDPNRPADATFFCRKIVQTLLSYKGGDRRVIRKCGYEKGEKPCYHYDDDDHAEVVCQCFDEACNSAPAGTRDGWRTALFAAGSTLLLGVLLH